MRSVPGFVLRLPRHHVPRVGGLVVCAVLAGCAPRGFTLPTGPRLPFPDYAAAFGAASARCRGVRTLSAELALSGRSGPLRLRGRVLAGFADPASIRLEGVAPFGAPAFILAARPGSSVLLLPRDDRVLRDAPPDAILEAIAGIALQPDDLRAILVGCLAPDPTAVSGQRVGTRWVAVELEGGATAYLSQRGGEYRVEAGQVGAFIVEYPEFAGAFPARVRLRSAPGGRGPAIDATVRISQLETNVSLGEDVFSAEVPESALPLSLDELRRAGPLGEETGDPTP